MKGDSGRPGIPGMDGAPGRPGYDGLPGVKGFSQKGNEFALNPTIIVSQVEIVKSTSFVK